MHKLVSDFGEGARLALFVQELVWEKLYTGFSMWNVSGGMVAWYPSLAEKAAIFYQWCTEKRRKKEEEKNAGPFRENQRRSAYWRLVPHARW